MIEIRTLADTPFEQIHKAMVNAFSDYVEQFEITEKELKYMIERRGYNSELSFGAFDGEKLVGITLNGVGDWKGERTAYDTGTGITKEYRKQGIASRMFNESLPVLRENNISLYLLEVIKSNTPAFDLYKKAGFKVTREFDYYTIDKDKIDCNNKKSILGYELTLAQDPNWKLYKTFWGFSPSWQNSIDSINRKIEHFHVLEFYKGFELAAYGIIEKHTGDIPLLAVAEKHRRNGLAQNLFYSLLDYTESEEIRITNSAADYNPFKLFAAKVGLPAGYGQYEMILKL